MNVVEKGPKKLGLYFWTLGSLLDLSFTIYWVSIWLPFSAWRSLNEVVTVHANKMLPMIIIYLNVGAWLLFWFRFVLEFPPVFN